MQIQLRQKDKLTILASLGTVDGTDRFRVSDAMILRFRRVRSPSCNGSESEAQGLADDNAVVALA
jgi:hypothetical protein